MPSPAPRRQDHSQATDAIECQKRRNRRIAKTRAIVDHVFGAMDQMGGKMIRTMGQALASFTMAMMAMMAACYNLKRLVYFRKSGIKAF